jgi:tetratricopeptide (TPR) repeat protein
VRLNAKLDRAWFGLGISHAALEQHPEAVINFEKAAQLQPMNPHALYELGIQHFKLNNTDQLAKVLERLRQFDPKATRQLQLATTVETESCPR